MLVRIEPLSSSSPPPGSWFYRGDNYSDAGGYLAGISAGRLKTFAFTHVEALIVSEQSFQAVAAISAGLAAEDGIWFGENSFEVVLQVAPAVAGYFKRRKLIANQVIVKELEDGGLLVSTRVGHSNQVLPHVRYWIPHIRIISPDELQKQLEAELALYLRAMPVLSDRTA